MKMKSKEQQKYDKLWTGVLAAILTPFFGFTIVSTIYSMNYDMEVYLFIRDYFWNTPQFQSPIISLSLILNLIPFYAFYRTKKDQGAKGVIMGTMIYIPIILYLKFLR